MKTKYYRILELGETIEVNDLVVSGGILRKSIHAGVVHNDSDFTYLKEIPGGHALFSCDCEFCNRFSST